MRLKTDPLILMPSNRSERSDSNELKGGLSSNIGNYRTENEDALIIAPLTLDEIKSASHTTINYCHKLWTTCKHIDIAIGQNKLTGGSTAGIIFFDGKTQLITTTLGDAASFAVVYNDRGLAVSVTRLNSITHKPGDSKERARIESAGGKVDNSTGIDRVCGIAISRTLGNFDSALNAKNRANDEPDLIISDPKIDTISYKDLRGYVEGSSRVQIIATSDGFTDAAPEQSRAGHEAYLLQTLNHCIINPGKEDEDIVADVLVRTALLNGSKDNVSVAVQTLVCNMPVLVAAFDGHGGADVAKYAVTKFANEFLVQCGRSMEEYDVQRMSVSNHEDAYARDNDPEFAPALLLDKNGKSAIYPK